MLMLKSKELREQRAKLVTDCRALMNGELTEEVRTKVTAMDADIDKLQSDIDLYEKQETRERELAAQSDSPIIPKDDKAQTEDRKKKNEEEVRKYAEAFDVYFRFGQEELSPEQRSILKQGYREDKPGQKEKRAQTVSTTGGGYLVPQGFMAELERAELAFGGVRQAARILKTESGNAIPWPTIDDTSNTGEDSTINTAANEEDMVFGSVTLISNKMDSGIILVPTELLEDTGINLDTEVGSMIGERLGRRQNAYQTTGLGVGTWQGVTIAATAALTTASPVLIAGDELIALQHKVDPAYRGNPKCSFMMNDDTVRLIRQLKDNNGRYLLDYSTLPGQFTTLLGFKVITNQQMATVASTAISVLFGDFGKFIVRDVRGVVVRRLNELYAVADQVAYIAWYRGDSRLVCASSKALVALTQHA
jgi:HK97 family phage major capsid protein